MLTCRRIFVYSAKCYHMNDSGIYVVSLATGQPGNSAGGSFAANQSPSVVDSISSFFDTQPSLNCPANRHRAPARRRAKRALEIRGHLSASRPARRPMERCRQHSGHGMRNNTILGTDPFSKHQSVHDADFADKKTAFICEICGFPMESYNDLAGAYPPPKKLSKKMLTGRRNSS